MSFRGGRKRLEESRRGLASELPLVASAPFGMTTVSRETSLHEPPQTIDRAKALGAGRRGGDVRIAVGISARRRGNRGARHSRGRRKTDAAGGAGGSPRAGGGVAGEGVAEEDRREIAAD